MRTPGGASSVDVTVAAASGAWRAVCAVRTGLAGGAALHSEDGDFPLQGFIGCESCLHNTQQTMHLKHTTENTLKQQPEETSNLQRLAEYLKDPGKNMHK